MFPVVAPLVIDISSDGTVAFIGEDFLFMCNVLGGPNNEFQWTLNTVFLPTETISTLQLTNVTVDDAGVYSCTVTNSAGEDSSETELFIAPNVITSPQDMTANATDNVTFTCVAEGAPVPNIMWEYAGIDDDDTPSTSDDSGSEFSVDTVVSLTTVNSNLTLEASFFNYGEYRCIATSDPLVLNVSATAILSGKCLTFPHCVFHNPAFFHTLQLLRMCQSHPLRLILTEISYMRSPALFLADLTIRSHGRSWTPMRYFLTLQNWLSMSLMHQLEVCISAQLRTWQALMQPLQQSMVRLNLVVRYHCDYPTLLSQSFQCSVSHQKISTLQ